MRAVLETRRKAAEVRVEELEAELARIQAALAETEEVLRRRVIGLEQYLEALAEADAPAVVTDGASQKRPDRAGRCPIARTQTASRCCRWTTRR
ncbi:hypothetical protein ACFUZA_27035 [Streptomyces cellulosae]|uniref:hypothetical protein n=1 Tax=Streptomyces cellulosae TaxID=1968 RepID=UPI0036D1D4BA